MEKKQITIKIKRELKDKIKEHGKMGDSYSSVIERALDMLEDSTYWCKKNPEECARAISEQIKSETRPQMTMAEKQEIKERVIDAWTFALEEPLKEKILKQIKKLIK